MPAARRRGCLDGLVTKTRAAGSMDAAVPSAVAVTPGYGHASPPDSSESRAGPGPRWPRPRAGRCQAGSWHGHGGIHKLNRFTQWRLMLVAELSLYRFNINGRLNLPLV